MLTTGIHVDLDGALAVIMGVEPHTLGKSVKELVLDI